MEQNNEQQTEAVKAFDIEESIIAFNNLYGLPVSPVPVLINSKRIKDHLEILRKEVDEGEDILKKMEHLEMMYKQSDAMKIEGVAWTNQAEQELEVLTDMADWLGDMNVYNLSEMAKWGLPPLAILEIIMASNMSKLGADGLPIVDESGKVQKGPNYWKPEPKIAEFLAKCIVNWRVNQMKERMQPRVDEVLATPDAQG